MLRLGRCFAFVLMFTLIAGNPASGSDNKTADAKTTSIYELRPVVFKADDLEEKAFAAINQQRAKFGLSPLRPARDLGEVARAHSQDMLTRAYFAHQTPEGKDLRYRFARHGITNWRMIAENIAYNSGYEDPVAAAVEGWMNSPGHRKNILNEKLSESGLGVAVGEDGRIYFTQVFATREEKATIARR